MKLQKKKQKNEDIMDDKGGGLLIRTEEYALKEDSKIEKANRWFNDDIFDEIETLDTVNKNADFEDNANNQNNDNKNSNESDNEKKDLQEENVNSGDKNTDQETANGIIESQPKFAYKDLPDILRLPYRLQRKIGKMNRDYRRRIEFEEAKRVERDCLFEEVPIDNKQDEEEDDSDAIAETLAVGHKLLTNKKEREDIINSSYHRYAFNDDGDEDGNKLPSWFVEDEKQNYKVNLPVTKEEVMEYKRRLKQINARPIKKVAEAKARKKLKAQRVWNKIKKQATGIADSTELSERSKIKQIEKLYGKYGKKVAKPPKVLMVASKNRKHRPADGKKPPRNALKVFVDSRLKKDKLGLKHAMKRKANNKKTAKQKKQPQRKNKRRR